MLLLDLIARPSVGKTSANDVHLEPEEVARVLDAIGDVDGYDDWLAVLMACHKVSGGLALEQCQEWSWDGDEELVAQKWSGFDAGRSEGSVGWGTLKRLCDANGGELSVLDALERGDPAEQFDDDLDSTGGDATAEEAKSPPGVMKGWVWVADASKFIRRTDLKQFKPDQWNSLYAGLEPDGSILTKVWKGKTPVRRFESLAYLPGRPELVKGGTYNIWRPSRIEPTEGDVSVIERHMELMFPDPLERGYVIDFMHFLCVRPEVKLQFALLIQGAQGTGKTAIGMLMKRIIGAANVVEPSPDELRKNWTKWQEGASLALLEELMMEGRLAVANKMKPVITNETLRIEDKNAPLYSIPNHLNIMGFTNHKDAVKLEEGDRRWLILFSPMVPQDEAYYERLFRFIDGPGPARWLHRLMDHEPTLNPKGRAPDTAAKAEMRETSLTDTEATVREWMASGTGPMIGDLFRFEEAWEQLYVSRPHKATLTRALTDAGCIKHARYTNPGLPNVALWSCRDHDRWEAAGPKGRVEAWLETQEDDVKRDFYSE